MNNKPLDDFDDDFLPFTPSDDEIKKEDINQEESNLNNDNNTLDIFSSYTDTFAKDNQANNLVDNQTIFENTNLSNNDTIDIFSDNNSNNLQEGDLVVNIDSLNSEPNSFLSNEQANLENETVEPKENEKKNKKIKNHKKKNNSKILTKGAKILPVIAFLFISVLGVYIFINNVNANDINLIKIEENSKVGYIDDEGEVIVKAKYLYGTDYYKGYAIVENYNSLYGIIDGKGNTEIAFGNIFSAILYDNRYVVSKFTTEGLKMGLLDANLKEVTRFKYDNLSYAKSGIFIFTRDETMGVMNSDGKELYTYKVDEVDDRKISIEVSNLSGDSTSDIYAKIKVNESSTIINTTTGEEVYKYTLDDIYVLDNNVFYIKDDSGNNKYFVIKDDEIVYETSEYKRIRIEDLDSNIIIAIKENSTIDYINLLTKAVINDNDNIKYTYSDGIILEEKYNFESSKNEFTITNPNGIIGTFTDIDPVDDTFVNDYMKINTDNGKYSYINKKGKTITKNEYEEAYDFDSNGFAIVCNDDQCGVINTDGKEVVSLKYDGIILLDEDLFNIVKDLNGQELFIFKDSDKYGIINSDGKIVIKAIYSDFKTITTKYPIIQATYNEENVLINLNTLKELTIQVSDDVDIYSNYIISSNDYYNYDGELIYSIGD